MKVQMLDAYSDELMRTALSSTPETSCRRLETIESMSESIGELVVESWTNETQYLSQGLRAATILACLPSLRTVTRLENHTQAIAANVTANLSDLGSRILASPDLSKKAIINRDGREAFSDSIGQMSETVILGFLWWGIAHGLRNERAYALPATKREDSRYPLKEDLSLATDIVLREPGRGKQRIQVKTSLKERDGYHPEVACVSLSQLMEQRTGRPRQLLGFLATHDNYKLGPMHQRMDERLHEAQDEAAELKIPVVQAPTIHDNTLSQAARTIKHLLGGRGGNRTLNP
jgi:hypothetical protein